MALLAPVDRPTHRALRAAVLHHRETERRRRFPPALHVGRPGLSHVHVERPGVTHDAGLRTDLALALLQRSLRDAVEPLAWLARPGDLELQDLDVLWGCAVRHAASSLGLPTGLVVVTRHGWRDPASGIRQEWRRLRRHRGQAGGT